MPRHSRLRLDPRLIIEAGKKLLLPFVRLLADVNDATTCTCRRSGAARNPQNLRSEI